MVSPMINNWNFQDIRNINGGHFWDSIENLLVSSDLAWNIVANDLPNAISLVFIYYECFLISYLQLKLFNIMYSKS